MNSVFGGYFLGFCFPESIFLGVLSVAKYFLSSSEIPNSTDPCRYVYQVHPLGVLPNTELFISFKKSSSNTFLA